MNDYLKEINKLIAALGGDRDTEIMVVNREGVIEFYQPCASSDLPELQFDRHVIGKKLLDVYEELSEENSTVMRTLRTGEISVGQSQTLTTGNLQIKILTTTHPILDERGEIRGAVDVARVLDQRRLDPSSVETADLSVLDDIVTANVEMKKLKSIIEEISRNDSPTIICGETGTGKELVAEALHRLSPRRDMPFIAQNCAAIPQTLLESIFFGTEKGGFTGAESKKGLFELADGGTLFLDEINSMELSMQAKLLKVLEEQSVRRIGGRQDIRVNVRILSASNEDPALLVKQGALRSDFYYRIGVVRLDIPPLRQRPGDIMLLTEHFIGVFNEKMHKQIRGLSQMARDLFLSWTWPGNIRELKNTVESAFNLERSDLITLDSLQELLKKVEAAEDCGVYAPSVSEPEPETEFSAESIKAALAKGPVDLNSLLESFEACVISQALSQNRKLSDVARQLSISPQKLQYRMGKLKLK